MSDAHADGEPVLWAKLTWPELRELGGRPPRMVILPLGTTEQHGRHLPVDVDVANCWEIACRVSAATSIPLLPPLAYGDSRFWEGWPGTLSLQPETFVQLLLEIADGVVGTGFRRLVLLNGHVGNGPALAIAEGKLRSRHPELQVRAISWWDVSPRVVEHVYADAIEGSLRSFHANDAETSVYLTHSPELVREELAVDEPEAYERPAFSYHSRTLTSSGVIGRATKATAEHGETIVRIATEDLVEFLGRCAAEDPLPDVWAVPERPESNAAR
jgi:creatinine amidohydrolase